jgi:hypothetical protein
VKRTLRREIQRPSEAHAWQIPTGAVDPKPPRPALRIPVLRGCTDREATGSARLPAWAEVPRVRLVPGRSAEPGNTPAGARSYLPELPEDAHEVVYC